MRRRLVLILGAAAILSGCNRAKVDTLDDTALQAIGDAVASGLNEPGAAVGQLLKSLDKPTPIGVDAMQITLDQKVMPIDWWLIQHGLVSPIVPPPVAGRTSFLVAPAGRQLSAEPPIWFNVTADDPSEVDCHTPQAIAAGGCEVDLTVTPSLTDAGAAAAGKPELKPIALHATVALVGDQWQVRDLRLTGPSLHDLAMTAVLGKEDARAAARQQVLAGLNTNAAQAGVDAQTVAAAQAGPEPAAPRFEPAPVAPVVGDSPYAARRRPAVP